VRFHEWKMTRHPHRTRLPLHALHALHS
jgi:hypothetical protein